MFKLRHMAAVAADAFEDMRPALWRAFNGSREDDRLDHVFGNTPRLNVLLILLGGLVLGNWISDFGLLRTLDPLVNFPAVLIGATHALLFRKYLFGNNKVTNDDFPWLAASLIPAAVVLVIITFGRLMLDGGAEPLPGAPAWTALAVFIDSIAESLVVAAALVIAVTALCFSRNWMHALSALFSQLIVFKVMMFVMVLLLVEIGIVGPILSALLSGLFGIHVPNWIGELFDRLTHALLMGVIYLFIIGAAWSAARDGFGELLEKGEVDILGALKRLASPEEQEKKEPGDGKEEAK